MSACTLIPEESLDIRVSGLSFQVFLNGSMLCENKDQHTMTVGNPPEFMLQTMPGDLWILFNRLFIIFTNTTSGPPSLVHLKMKKTRTIQSVTIACLLCTGC